MKDTLLNSDAQLGPALLPDKNVHKFVQFLSEFQFQRPERQTQVDYLDYSLQKCYFEIDENVSSLNMWDTIITC